MLLRLDGLTEESSYSECETIHIPALIYILPMWPVGPILNVQHFKFEVSVNCLHDDFLPARVSPFIRDNGRS